MLGHNDVGLTHGVCLVVTEVIKAVAEASQRLDIRPMKLDFSLGDIDQFWIDGALPSTLRENKDRKVKAQLAGKSDSPFPPSFPVGELLCSERPKPKLQHAATLMLTYLHSITPSPAVQDDNGWWTIPGSEVHAQIRIPLTAEAIVQIHKVDGDASVTGPCEDESWVNED